MPQQPALFISHGAPNIILSDLPARHFLEDYGRSLAKPDAILMVSAHFEHPGVAVVSDPAPGMIYDFGGFEPELYRMTYPAPGSAAVAAKAMALLADAGFAPVNVAKRGYDHGAWNPLKLLVPEADIPVVQVSVDPSQDARHHYEVGQALAPLRGENVLVIGSGHITHNLRGFFHRGRNPAFDSHLDAATTAFVDWVRGRVDAGDIDALLDWERQAPFAADNHPEAEHFMPFFVALGAGGPRDAQRLHHSVQNGFFYYDHYAFGAAA